jgi:hypothetical protein
MIKLKDWDKHIGQCKDFQFNIDNEIKNSVVKDVKR